jgi:hypothetical protein
VKGLHDIRDDLAAGRYDFSRHAFRRAVERNISEQEIREAGTGAEIIEDYPDDKYSPSVLLLGYSASGRALHMQVSCGDGPATKIITLYEPDPDQWIDDRVRS